MHFWLASSQKNSFVKNLLDWFSKNKRDLPWRKNKNPYRIWLSEIMLQQTTVQTVISYYDRFLKKFPTLKSVANADYSDLIPYWQGLGYYRRLKHFHQAARELISQKRNIPKTAKDLIKLPGLGSYTANAIASIAFNEAIGVVDGNVLRVISRLALIKDPIDLEKTKKTVGEICQNLIPKERPGDFNQALMELGSTICRPQKPLCLLCPLNQFCAALKKGKVDQLPVKKNKIDYKKVNLVALVFLKKKQILLTQRASNQNQPLMWELPYLEENKVLESSKAWQIEGLEFKEYEKKAKVNHAIMNKRFRVEPWVVKDFCGRKSQNYQWVQLSQISKITLTTKTKKVLQFMNK